MARRRRGAGSGLRDEQGDGDDDNMERARRRHFECDDDPLNEGNDSNSGVQTSAAPSGQKRRKRTTVVGPRTRSKVSHVAPTPAIETAAVAADAGANANQSFIRSVDSSSNESACSGDDDDVVSESDTAMMDIICDSAKAMAEAKHESQKHDHVCADPAPTEAVPTGADSVLSGGDGASLRGNVTALGAEAPQPAQPSLSSSTTIILEDVDDDNADNAAIAGRTNVVITEEVQGDIGDIGDISVENARPEPEEPEPPVFTPAHSTEGHRAICKTLLPILFAVIREDQWRGRAPRDQIREACWRTMVQYGDLGGLVLVWFGWWPGRL